MRHSTASWRRQMILSRTRAPQNDDMTLVVIADEVDLRHWPFNGVFAARAVSGKAADLRSLIGQFVQHEGGRHLGERDDSRPFGIKRAGHISPIVRQDPVL